MSVWTIIVCRALVFGRGIMCERMDHNTCRALVFGRGIMCERMDHNCM